MRFRWDVTGAILIAVMGATSAQADSRQTFSIPAGPLSKALLEAGATAHSPIAFSPTDVANRAVPAVSGTFTLTEVLDRLLAGSGLTYDYTTGRSYIVRKAVTAQPQPLNQPAADPDPPVVVVTGYRRSLETAISLKRRSNGLVDSIVADDIAKFPDNNLAEAIGRVSGVAITRDQGEGRSISVRGLGPEFTRVELNGVEAQAATDGLTQGVNHGRGFDFNVFPSELFSRVDVRKTANAQVPEGSLGATVELVTPHPFDRKGIRFAVSAQKAYNDLSDRTGTRGTALVSNTFFGDRLGILLTAAYSATPLEVQGVNSGGWNQGTANGGFCRPTAGTGGICDVPASDLEESSAAYDSASKATVYLPQFYRYTDLIGRVTRFGVVGSVQWQPSDRTMLTTDLLISRFHTERHDHFLEAIGFSRGALQGGKPETIPRRVEVNAENTMLYGLFDNVDVRAEHGIDDFTTTFVQASLRLRHRFSPRLTFNGQIAWSHSQFDNARELYVQIDRYNVDGYTFDIRSGGQQHPSINYNFDVTDPDAWYFGPRTTAPGGIGATSPEIRLRPNFVRNGYDTARASFSYEFDGGNSLTAGADTKRYSYRAISYRFDQGEADFAAPNLPLASLTTTFCGEGAVSPPAGTARCWREPDIGAFVAAYNVFGGTGRTSLSSVNTAARPLNQAIAEDDFAGFVRFDFRCSLFGFLTNGDVGVRLVQTTQDSIFYANVPTDDSPGAYREARVRRQYTDALPSLNMVLEPDTDTAVRFSAAEVIARPPLSSLAAATSVQVRGGQRLVVTGNPNLKPYRAASFDLSYEHYSPPGGLLSLGVFYKNISTYVQNLVRIAPYSTTGLPADLLTGTGVGPSDDFSISNVVNTPGGPLVGVEFTYQQPLRFLPTPFSGLGVLFNATHVISKVKYQTTSATGETVVVADLVNLSRNAYNATLYFDHGPFQARISTNYRDKYLTNVPGSFSADAGGVDAAAYWDCAISYRLRPGLTVSFEGLNLTNESNVTWDGTATRRVGDYRITGRQIHIGVRYGF